MVGSLLRLFSSLFHAFSADHLDLTVEDLHGAEVVSGLLTWTPRIPKPPLAVLPEHPKVDHGRVRDRIDWAIVERHSDPSEREPVRLSRLGRDALL